MLCGGGRRLTTVCVGEFAQEKVVIVCTIGRATHQVTGAIAVHGTRSVADLTSSTFTEARRIVHAFRHHAHLATGTVCIVVARRGIAIEAITFIAVEFRTSEIGRTENRAVACVHPSSVDVVVTKTETSSSVAGITQTVPNPSLLCDREIDAVAVEHVAVSIFCPVTSTARTVTTHEL